MTRRIKVNANESAATAQHAAISIALGHPSRGVHVGGGRHVAIPDVPTDDDHAGWTVEAVSMVDGPGPTVGVDVTGAEVDALHGQTVEVPGRGEVVISTRPARDMRQDETHRRPRVAR